METTPLTTIHFIQLSKRNLKLSGLILARQITVFSIILMFPGLIALSDFTDFKIFEIQLRYPLDRTTFL